MKKLHYLAVLLVCFSINLTQCNADEVYQPEILPEAQVDQEEGKDTVEASKTSIVKRIGDMCIGVGISVGVVWVGSAVYKVWVHGDTFLQAINPIFGGLEKRIKYQLLESAKILDNKNLKEDQKKKKLRSLFRRRHPAFLFVLPTLRKAKQALDESNPAVLRGDSEGASYKDVVDIGVDLLGIFKQQVKKFLREKREILFEELLKSPDKTDWALFLDEEYLKPFEQSKLVKQFDEPLQQQVFGQAKQFIAKKRSK